MIERFYHKVSNMKEMCDIMGNTLAFFFFSFQVCYNYGVRKVFMMSGVKNIKLKKGVVLFLLTSSIVLLSSCTTHEDIKYIDGDDFVPDNTLKYGVTKIYKLDK